MIINNSFHTNVGKVPSGKGNQLPDKINNSRQQGSFEEILRSKSDENSAIKFSKHAQMRLQTRNINLSDNQKEKISQAVQRAEEKGVKDSLVLMDNMAFVVSIKSRTVITAVNSSELKENVFTNIDGAVIA